MTTPITRPPDAAPRPGSRAARMLLPIATDVLRQTAEQNGVCPHPIALRRTDTVTGQTEIVEVPCGARLASRCKVCAERNRRLRIQQIREGWHLADEPTPRPGGPGEDVLTLVRLRAHLEFARDDAERHAQWGELADVDRAIAEVDDELSRANLRGHLTPTDRKAPPRRVRSTKRRQDAPDLPRLPVDPRTVGRTYTARDGSTHRPSMLVSLTLGSYGPVHTAARYRRGGLRPCQCGALHGQQDPLLGVPLDPATYDYRRAALDAIHYASLLDRWWQNLRRAAGWNVQYAGCNELQKRLAPHGHFAIRGTLPRKLLKQVAAATYHQVWWPAFDSPQFTVTAPPVWNPAAAAYVHPRTGEPLPTWPAALDTLDASDAAPAYVARLGTIDARGVSAGTKDAERSIRYITKYVTKDITDHAHPHSAEQRAHFDRLHAELAVLPCSPTCANWLLNGVQPDRAKPGLVPGRCTGKVHQRDSLGFTGRRVLISRQWSNKTLADVRADNREWVRAILAGSLDEQPAGDEHQDQDVTNERPDPTNGPKRYLFALARPGEPDVPPVEHRLLRAISLRLQWREQLNIARQRAQQAVSANEINAGEAQAA